jgi:8-oxo-dGTP diphosphatase
MSLITSQRGDQLLAFHSGDIPPSERSIPLPLALVVPRHEGKVLFVFNRWRDEWELPGGMIEPGEQPVDAARRELEEESGQTAADLHYVGWMKFRLQPHQRLELAVLYQCELETVQPFEANDETTAIMLWDLHSPVSGYVNEIDKYLATATPS